MDLHATATYMGLSEWAVKDLDGAGIIRRVRIPLPGDRELRKYL